MHGVVQCVGAGLEIDINLNLFNVRCREYTFRYKKDS